PLHSIFIPLMGDMVRREAAHVIINEESLKRHLEWRTHEKVRVNLNHLGEAILGEEEATDRLNIYLKDLADPAVEYFSVKISSIYSQVSLLGRKKSLEILGQRLKTLYRMAKSHTFERDDGQLVTKFINLDMEEYRDLHLTVELFQEVL